jgi:hypothetical protein
VSRWTNTRAVRIPTRIGRPTHLIFDELHRWDPKEYEAMAGGLQAGKQTLRDGWLAEELLHRDPREWATITEISSSWMTITRRRSSWRERWLTLPWWRGRIYGLRQRLADWIEPC